MLLLVCKKSSVAYPILEILFSDAHCELIWSTALIGINVCFGIMMADFTQCPTTKEAVKKRRYLLSLGSSCMIILGLYICSFPEDHYEWASWSDGIAQASNMAIPISGELSRYIHSVGAQIFILGLHFSDLAKKALSNRLFVWMGKRSFAVYLIHPLFIRTVLVWVMYGTIKLPNDFDDYGKPIPPGILIWYK